VGVTASRSIQACFRKTFVLRSESNDWDFSKARMRRNAVDEFLRKRQSQRRQAMTEGLGFVMGVNLIIWFGIAFYLFILDRKIRKLEQS